MLNLLLMFALASSSTAAGHSCPPPGFEHAGYVSTEDAAALAASVEHQLVLVGDNYWSGPAGMEGRPAAVNLDLYVQANGEVAGVCIVSGERHVIATVARGLALVKLPPMGRLGRSIVPLEVKLAWRSARSGMDLIEFRGFELKVAAAPRP